MTTTDAIDRDDRARHASLAAPRPYRRGSPRVIEGLPERLPDAVRAYLDVLPEGRVVGFNLAGLDRTGIPVWFVALFLDDPFFNVNTPDDLARAERRARRLKPRGHSAGRCI